MSDATRSWTIRPEAPGDVESIDRVNRLAFGRGDEADLVAALRRDADPFISLVAIDGETIGHAALTPVTIGDDRETALGLGPVAVLPERQGTGVGAALVEAGLAAARQRGRSVVFVLGDPAYYGRFGFELAPPRGLRFGPAMFDDAFQMIELRPGAAATLRGEIHYHPAFDGV